MGKGDKGPWGQSSGGGNPWGGGSSGGNGGGGKPPSGGGGGGPQGPDFDEMMRKGQEKIHDLFPGGGDSKKGFALFFAILLVLWLASGVYFVKADEQGVVLRFGEYHRTTSAGMNYHFPFPIETVAVPKVTAINRVEVGVRSGFAGRSRATDASIPEESLMLTGDENIVEINFEVQWKIDNAPDYLFNIRDPEKTVKAVAESAMREIVGQIKIASVLAEGKLKVEQDTKKLMQAMLNTYKAGIDVVSVNLLKADPPSQVIDSFRDVQTARADMETKRNQADSYRNDIIPKARGQAEKLVLDAEAYKQEVIARAKGEASRFAAVYAEYKQAKGVTKRRMYLETMEEVLQDMNKVIIDTKGSQGVLPYLPLSELKNKNAQGAN